MQNSEFVTDFEPYVCTRDGVTEWDNNESWNSNFVCVKCKQYYFNTFESVKKEESSLFCASFLPPLNDPNYVCNKSCFIAGKQSSKASQEHTSAAE